MSNYIQSTVPGYVIDKSSRTILNTNPVQYKAILSQRESSTKIHHLQNEINDIKSDITEIRDMLRQFITK
jgi:hypothetical protein